MAEHLADCDRLRIRFAFAGESHPCVRQGHEVAGRYEVNSCDELIPVDSCVRPTVGQFAARAMSPGVLGKRRFVFPERSDEKRVKMRPFAGEHDRACLVVRHRWLVSAIVLRTPIPRSYAMGSAVSDTKRPFSPAFRRQFVGTSAVSR